MIPHSGTLHLSTSRLRHNLALFRARSPALLCATVKANAYGHGINLLLPLLAAQGLTWACVYTLPEAIAASRLAPTMNILTLAPLVGTIDSPTAQLLAHTPIRATLTDLSTLRALSAALSAPARIHIQIDTGLTRAGISLADAPTLLHHATQLPNIILEGIFSHLSHGDVPHHPTLQQQAESLHRIAAPFKQKNPALLVHLQNSGGAWHLQNLPVDMVRLGIGLYGLQPSTTHPIPNLQPIAHLTAPILAIHSAPANTGIGYGHTFITTRPSRLAILPVGYADGYPRALSNHALVQIAHTTAPVVGRVSMDQIIIDITDIPTATLGDHATLISHHPTAPNSLDALATQTHTIGYELATHLGPRLHRTLTP